MTLLRSTLSLLTLLPGLTLGCSANSGDGTGGPTVGATGGTTSTGSGGTSTGSGGTLSSSGGSLSAGGSGFGVGGGPNPGVGGSGGFEECDSVDQTATNQIAPSDIIMMVDTSGSMTEEAGFVRSAISIFATGLPSKGIDYHVVMLAEGFEPPPFPGLPADGICVPAPMGSGSCPNDSRPPQFVHLPITVASTNSLQLVLDNWSQINPNLRPNSTKHLLVISDDNSQLAAADFDMQFRNLLSSSGHAPSYTLHAVYGFTDGNCPSMDPCCGGLFGMSLTASVGTVYRELAMLTGGQQGNLCLQEQGFVSSFTAVSQQVVANSKLACEWAIPAPPEGESFNPNLVNVEFLAAGAAPEGFGYVSSPGECANVADAWYYDNPNAPTTILVCPQTCQRIQAAADAQMNIQFGCNTQVAPPK